MALSNAERQKRHRERCKQLTREGVGHLTGEQIADRNAVMADPLYPVPAIGPMRDRLPTFMGWNRYDWSVAPEALIDHFEMRSAFEGWRAEHAEIDAARDRAEPQETADRLWPKFAMRRLLDEIAQDPTLGPSPTVRHRVK